MLTVAEQVGVLFLLIATGAWCRHIRMFSEMTVKQMVELLSEIITPAVIIHAFMRPFDRHYLAGLGIALLAAFAAHIIGFLYAILFIRLQDKSRESVLRFATIFSNAGFMALPLEYALFGKDGVFYGSVYVAVFNLLCWSAGIVIMRGSFRDVGWKKVFINPGSKGILLGLPFFLLSLKVPAVVSDPIRMLADMNTPLAMLVIGYYLGGASFRPLLTSFAIHGVTLLRLIVIPLTMVLLFHFFTPADKLVALALVTSSSAPTAALTAMLAARYDRDVAIGVGSVAFTTLLSILTMPIVIGIAHMAL